MKHISKIDVVLSTFRAIYARQLGSNNQVKNASLKRAIALRCDNIYTEDVFNRDIANRIDLLLSSAHFVEACRSKNLDEYSAASHFVLLGWQKLEDCILRGGYIRLEDYAEWSTPMFPKELMIQYVHHIGLVLKGKEAA